MESILQEGICRCCGTDGNFKDFLTSFHWMGVEEVYADMLKDCFSLTLSTSDQVNNGGICEVCITQLRNACNFKMQVQHTEEQFKKRVQEALFKPEVIKLETDIQDDVENSDIGDTLSDDFPLSVPEYEVPIKTEKSEDKTPKKRAAKASTSSKAKKPKTTDDGEPSSKRTDGGAPKRKKKTSDVSATPERIEHRVNLTTILRYSNASPFRDKTARGFSCLYCAKYFKQIEDLRVHTAQKKEKDKINKMLDYKLSYNPIKLDITDLQCTICNCYMLDLNELKDHLAYEHAKTIHKNIKDIILPFRLENGQNFSCVICSVVHVSFKTLYHHMSSHYRNYCCKKCGAGYITIAALRKHGKTHYQGHFPCDYCDKFYTSLTKKRNHEKGVHKGGWLRNKCPHCPEIFVSYYDRSEHLVKVHNETPIYYPCNACNKKYKKKFELNRHIKHHHLQQKSFLCDKCNSKFFSKRGLIDHMTRHTGAEFCSCDVCGKSFYRTRTLREHMKLHEDDKRFQCGICKKTFMQKSSLKSHVKLHQDDLDIFKEFDDVKHLIDDREMTLKEIAAESKKKALAEKLECDKSKTSTKKTIETVDLVSDSEDNPELETVVKIESMSDEIEIGDEDEPRKTPSKRKSHKEQLLEMQKHLKNISTILLHSNATPIRYHDGANYVCALCPETYPVPSELKRHVLEEHDEIDKSSFMEGQTLTSYVVKLDITHLRCLICHSEIENFAPLMEHLQSIHGKELHLDIPNHILPFRFVENYFDCVLCPKSYEHFKLIQEHMSTHYGNYACETCDAKFVSKKIMQNHANRHKKGNFPCSFCKKIFDTNRKKTNHENYVHVGDYKRKKCPHCPEKFANYSAKRTHMVKEHGADPLLVKCDVCKKEFTSRARLRGHTRRVHLESKHACTECDMKFYTKRDLSKHMIKHSSNKPYQCDVCKKMYARKHTLAEHLKIHSNVRKFKCKLCKLKFVHKSNLKSHLRHRHKINNPKV